MVTEIWLNGYCKRLNGNLMGLNGIEKWLNVNWTITEWQVKHDWMVTKWYLKCGWMVTETGLNGHWNVSTIQSTEC